MVLKQYIFLANSQNSVNHEKINIFNIEMYNLILISDRSDEQDSRTYFVFKIRSTATNEFMFNVLAN